jgi:hypothetical protein
LQDQGQANSGPASQGGREPRSISLSDALATHRLSAAWKGTVRQGLRNQDLPDLHDHLDVHWRLPKIAARLNDEVLTFTYRPREPEIVRLEKALGITRRTVIPSPSDAIVLQAVVDAITPQVLKAQPTKSAFYSRSHSRRIRSVAKMDETYPSDWLQLWKEGQRRIWEFAKEYDVIVVTDIANYFDAIPLSQLRNRLVSLGRFEESLIDLLFYSLEALTWRPEYLPRSGAGLPQILFDAPRLLAHAYLYEADAFLASKGDFVRWMDDITFGAANVTAAKSILRDLDELLASLGVRLNAGKTKVLTADEGVAYFRMIENRTLTTIQNMLSIKPNSSATRERVSVYLRSFWRRVYNGGRTGYWDKVIKRLFTLFGELRDPYLQRWVFDIIASQPSLREPAFRYLRAVGYSRSRFKRLIDFLKSEDCLDDVALFGGARLLVDWNLPMKGKSRAEAVRLAFTLPSQGKWRPAGLCAGVWILCKYGTEADVGRLVKENERSWRASEWASRQVAAATVRMTSQDAAEVSRVIVQYGLLEGSAVLVHLQELEERTTLNTDIRSYIQHESDPYPLQKLLILVSLIRSRIDRNAMRALKDKAMSFIRDPIFRAIIASAWDNEHKQP